ncbi:MAG TPA: cupin domain-containing protein [Candidatus Tenderia electrophaga]|uniref:Cupin domain-containing protein n=1 Tax=Candidatus Tenderia electrophaga TaxID=1748243 RepID=A0A832N6A1_9GAMM|nr:cupin domain-containing protein [Candidatus Tenderia electrophaga]
MSRPNISHYAEVKPFETKDGSVIRELMHPRQHSSQQQSLAEARLCAGQKTLLHRHLKTEELYYITHGRGLMTVAEQCFEVQAGDTVCIAPGQAHCIENVATEPLILLCCCSPAYSHDDTEILSTE